MRTEADREGKAAESLHVWDKLIYGQLAKANTDQVDYQY